MVPAEAEMEMCIRDSVDGDPPGPQGVGPREGDGARSGERSGTGEPGVAGRQRYIPVSYTHLGHRQAKFAQPFFLSIL